MQRTATHPEDNDPQVCSEFCSREELYGRRRREFLDMLNLRGLVSGPNGEEQANRFEAPEFRLRWKFLKGFGENGCL